jgi:hypothetical protein
VVNSTDPVHEYQFAGHKAPKPVIEVLVLGKPTMTAEIELKSSLLESRGQAANITIPLENSYTYAVRAQLMSDG